MSVFIGLKWMFHFIDQEGGLTECQYEELQKTNKHPGLTKEKWNEICSFLCYEAWGEFTEGSHTVSESETSEETDFPPDRRVDGLGLGPGRWRFPFLFKIGKVLTQGQVGRFPQAPRTTFGQLRIGGMRILVP